MNLTLPKSRKKNIDFREYVSNVYDNFLSYVKEKNFLPESDILKLESSIELLNNTISNYYKGSHNKAFTKLKKYIDENYNSLSIKKTKTNEKYYRARQSSELSLKKEVLFHIPFNRRFELVTNQRFSYQSYPCLYLGDSSFTCWLELNKPNFDGLHFSEYEISNPLKYLDLCIDIDPKKITNKKANFSNLIFTWPLSFLCTIKVLNPEHNFHPEYIAPQLLTEIVINSTSQNKINGIKFYSTKYSSSFSTKKSYNYVSPAVEELKYNYFCDFLQNNMKFTKSFSWNYIDLISPGWRPKNFNIIEEEISNFSYSGYIYDLELPDKEVIRRRTKELKYLKYKVSKFGLIEEYLATQKKNSIVGMLETVKEFTYEEKIYYKKFYEFLEKTNCPGNISDGFYEELAYDGFTDKDIEFVMNNKLFEYDEALEGLNKDYLNLNQDLDSDFYETGIFKKTELGAYSGQTEPPIPE